MKIRYMLFVVWLALTIPGVSAVELRAAVAANFLGTLQQLTQVYAEQTGHHIHLSSGSSGALYAQIVNGAPFDLFFSADIERAKALVDNDLALEASRFTYAIGVPVLWSSKPDYLDDPVELLRTGSYRFLSITDPRNAPYGVAAQQIFEHLGIWESLNREGRLLRAQTITQVYTQVASGAAELGVVALAQLNQIQKDGVIPGSHWIPPAEWFTPIEQQAVILKRANDADQAQQFMTWMRSPEAVKIIEEAGYALP